MTDEKNTFPPADSVEDAPEISDAETAESHESNATAPSDEQQGHHAEADAAGRRP